VTDLRDLPSLIQWYRSNPPSVTSEGIVWHWRDADGTLHMVKLTRAHVGLHDWTGASKPAKRPTSTEHEHSATTKQSSTHTQKQHLHKEPAKAEGPQANVGEFSLIVAALRQDARANNDTIAAIHMPSWTWSWSW